MHARHQSDNTLITRDDDLMQRQPRAHSQLLRSGPLWVSLIALALAVVAVVLSIADRHLDVDVPMPQSGSLVPLQVASRCTRTRDSIEAALRAGARGYLLKGASQDDVADAIRARRERPCRPTDRALPSAYLSRLTTAGGAPPTFPELTERERDVLRHVAAGHNNVTIGRALPPRRRPSPTTFRTSSPSCRSPTGQRRSSAPARGASSRQKRPDHIPGWKASSLRATAAASARSRVTRRSRRGSRRPRGA